MTLGPAACQEASNAEPLVRRARKEPTCTYLTCRSTSVVVAGGAVGVVMVAPNRSSAGRAPTEQAQDSATGVVSPPGETTGEVEGRRLTNSISGLVDGQPGQPDRGLSSRLSGLRPVQCWSCLTLLIGGWRAQVARCGVLIGCIEIGEGDSNGQSYREGGNSRAKIVDKAVEAALRCRPYSTQYPAQLQSLDPDILLICYDERSARTDLDCSATCSRILLAVCTSLGSSRCTSRLEGAATRIGR